MILQFVAFEDIPDVLFEGLTVVGYMFVLVMAIYAQKKNRIFASKGFPLLVFAIGLGLVSSAMDFISEFVFINNYEIFKLIMEGFQIAGLVLFTIAMSVLFKFTQFMLGDGDTEQIS